MKVTVIDTKTGKARVMERRFAQILSKLGKVRRPKPVKRKPKAEEPVEESLEREPKVERKEDRPKKREYKRRDLKAEE